MEGLLQFRRAFRAFAPSGAGACIFAARLILSSRCFSRRSCLRSRRSSGVNSFQWAAVFTRGMIFFFDW